MHFISKIKKKCLNHQAGRSISFCSRQAFQRENSENQAESKAAFISEKWLQSLMSCQRRSGSSGTWLGPQAREALPSPSPSIRKAIPGRGLENLPMHSFDR